MNSNYKIQELPHIDFSKTTIDMLIHPNLWIYKYKLQFKLSDIFVKLILITKLLYCFIIQCTMSFFYYTRFLYNQKYLFPFAPLLQACYRILARFLVI